MLTTLIDWWDNIMHYELTPLLENILSSAPFTNPIPSDVWDYGEFSSWNELILDLISDIIDDNIKKYFIDNEPEDFCSDDFSWLDHILRINNKPDVNVLAILESRMRERFRAIRCYHATRAYDIKSFYDHGLLPLDPKQAQDRIREIFLNNNFPEITDEIFDKTISDLNYYLEAKKNAGETGINFVLNKYILLGSHYLKAGSEYSQNIVRRLSSDNSMSERYLSIFTENSQPILLICNIPLDMIPTRLINSLIRTSLYSAFRQLIEDMSSHIPDGGVVTNDIVPPEHIIDHAIIPV